MEGAHLVWVVLAIVLALVASGRARSDFVALAGLVFLGLAGAAPPEILFAGFSHPAVITVAAVLVVSAGITASGALRGIGIALAHRLPGVRGQILGLGTITALLSAFMNNVGALGITLPAAERMARRAGVEPGVFGLPLAQAAILGGTLTLIGSAPNLIISSYRAGAGGAGFGMFAFAPHGLAALVAGVIVWSIGSRDASSPISAPDHEEDAASTPLPGPTSNRAVVLGMVGIAVVVVAFGLVPAPVGFAAAGLVFVATGVLPPAEVYRRMRLRVVVFLAGMIGLGEVLEFTGGLDMATQAVLPGVTGLPGPALVIAFLFASTILSNAINNSAAAVIMGGLAPSVAEFPGVAANADALWMAVAAGACIALILPTHQATVLAMARTPFAPIRFVRAGLTLTLASGVAAGLVIWWIWA